MNYSGDCFKKKRKKNIAVFVKEILKGESAVVAILPSIMEGELLCLWIILWLSPQSNSAQCVLSFSLDLDHACMYVVVF